MAGQMRDLDPGEDQKAGVVGDVYEVSLSLDIVPANPAITCVNLLGSSAKEQTGKIASLPILHEIPKVLTDVLAAPQIMMGG